MENEPGMSEGDGFVVPVGDVLAGAVDQQGRRTFVLGEERGRIFRPGEAFALARVALDLHDDAHQFARGVLIVLAAQHDRDVGSAFDRVDVPEVAGGRFAAVVIRYLYSEVSWEFHRRVGGVGEQLRVYPVFGGNCHGEHIAEGCR